MITFQPLNSSIIERTVCLMKEFYAIDNYTFDSNVASGLCKEFIKNDHLGKAWLIFHNNEAIGYVILTFAFSFEYQGKIAFLDELYLTEKVRGKGIGSMVIEFIKLESKKLDLKLLYLEVEEHNLKAQNLYLANGFEMHHRKLMRLKT